MGYQGSDPAAAREFLTQHYNAQAVRVATQHGYEGDDPAEARQFLEQRDMDIAAQFGYSQSNLDHLTPQQYLEIFGVYQGLATGRNPLLQDQQRTIAGNLGWDPNNAQGQTALEFLEALAGQVAASHGYDPDNADGQTVLQFLDGITTYTTTWEDTDEDGEPTGYHYTQTYRISDRADPLQFINASSGFNTSNNARYTGYMGRLLEMVEARAGGS